MAILRMVTRNRRVFVVRTNNLDKVAYSKSAQSVDFLLERLTEKGLIIDNEVRARHALRLIGYYRLLSYMRRYQIRPQKTFLAETRFSDILEFYELDRSIRMACLDAIERIEVCLRSVLSNEISIAHGPHWYTNSELFGNTESFSHIVRHIEYYMGARSAKRHHENGISHYHSKYNSPPLPPSWVTFENLSFSKLSQILASLHRAERTKVARYFDLPEKLVVSWMHTISDFRNCCAHHERLLNRRFKFQPSVAKKEEIRFFDDIENQRLYARIVIIVLILRSVDLHSHFRNQIRALLLTKDEMIDSRDIPDHWKDHSIWK